MTKTQHNQAQGSTDTLEQVGVEAGVSSAELTPAAKGSAESPVWPEAADFQCSENAALFAGTQPAPLSVV
jgi:lipid-binding SYLF domain-containing protein